ncbi:DUF4189 domain-containing protein [Nocardia sp. CDC160]|uniref:DUF4189 domain-containing protein n=1 Tax=Nocardia sp. CDC160 TaxID=3112166 RepID=UPI002DBBB019|nr:DUF4189 domain-containing protein [Nocardia sp. CDC160]MEC3917244.1 DUF4189 domain-containing protein [Nocardia sp. CDC160]
MSRSFEAFGMSIVAAVAVVTCGTGVAAAEAGPDGHYYGSMAGEILGDQVAAMWGVNYPDWGEADAAALSFCETDHCQVLARFVDGCGSIAVKNDTLMGGVGRTQGDAEGAAMGAFGPPDLVSMSAGQPGPQVVHSECTANSG